MIIWTVSVMSSMIIGVFKQCACQVHFKVASIKIKKTTEHLL